MQTPFAKKGPVPCLEPLSFPLLCFQFINSFRKPSSVETRNNDLLHPVECQTPSPPQIIHPLSPMKLSPHGPSFLNLNKMRIPLKCFTPPHAYTEISSNTTFFLCTNFSLTGYLQQFDYIYVCVYVLESCLHASVKSV